MANLYHLWTKVRDFERLSQQDRDNIINTLSEPDSAKDYSFLGYLSSIIRFLDKNETKRIFDNTTSNCPRSRSYNENVIFEIVKRSYEFDEDHTKKVVLGISGSDIYDKTILLFNNLTKDEELRGLRALGARKYCPSALHQHRYAPSKEAIQDLPPVFRLKVLETLANTRHLSYNIFKNFPDPDEFKNLMFSSVLRHRERAEAVWNKYQEIAFLGQDAEIKIKTSCSNCGDFETIIKSKRIRTKTGLLTTNLWNSFRYGCALCGNGSKTMEIIELGKESNVQSP